MQVTYLLLHSAGPAGKSPNHIRCSAVELSDAGLIAPGGLELAQAKIEVASAAQPKDVLAAGSRSAAQGLAAVPFFVVGPNVYEAFQLRIRAEK